MTSSERRPRRLLLPLTMLIVLVVVIFGVYKIIPLGPESGLGLGKAGRQLAEAGRLEAAHEPAAAAAIYEKLLANPKASGSHRVGAALRLGELYRNALGKPEAAEAVLRKAFLLAAPGGEQEEVRRAMEAANLAPDIPPSATGTVIARIGAEVVTLEEILYAWNQFNGGVAPGADELEPFVRSYLDLALLADEARRLKLSLDPKVAYELRLKRLLGLSQAMLVKLTRDLPEPDEATLRHYYETHKAAFTRPARAQIGTIVATDDDIAAQAARALKNGEPFEEVAVKYSSDAKRLKNGYLLGEVTADMPSMPGSSALTGLPARLVAASDGTTTGPLKTARGQEWFKVLSHTPASLPPLEAITDEVLLAYQLQQREVQRQALLARLRQDPRVVIGTAGSAPAAPSAEAVAAQSSAAAAPLIPSDPQ